MPESHTPESYRGAHVLIAGGGVAALEAAFALRALAGDLVDLEIVAAEPKFFYRPQAVFEPFGGVRVQAFELRRAGQGAGGAAHPRRARVRCSVCACRSDGAGNDRPYDVLVIATGATPTAVLRDAVQFRSPADDDRVAAIARSSPRVDDSPLTLAIPARRTWPLPIYELAFGCGASATGRSRWRPSSRWPATRSVGQAAPT